VARKGAYASMWNKQKKAEAARERLKKVEADPQVTPGIARVTPATAAGE
jgi:ATP-binding cassette, subfamily B, heavy metal transporter